jgi:ankyrin repeat protein
MNFLFALILTGCGQHHSQSSGYLQSSGSYQGQKPETPEAIMAYLIETGDLAGLRARLDDGLDRNMRVLQGRTLLIHATIQQKGALMAELIRREADRTLKDESGRTALEHAQDLGFIRGWILLDDEKRAFENAQLLKFVKRRSSQKVEDQLRYGADPNFRDENGEPLIHIAIRQFTRFPDAMNVIEVLARWQDPDQLNSINLYQSNAGGESALALAHSLELNPVIELLTSLGVKE